MITYKNFKDYLKVKVLKLHSLWNDELGFIFPISEELMQRNTYNTLGFLEEHSYVALNDNEPIGFVINKIWLHDYHIENNLNTGWISLIYVKKKFRNMGIGSELLQKSIDAFKSLGCTKIYLGRDYQNFFPGLPVDLKAHLKWFTKRGFCGLYDTNDLVNNKLDFKYELRDYTDNSPYTIRIGNKLDLPKIDAFFKKNFPGRWHVEFLDYVSNGGNGSEYLICLDQFENVCGFCKIQTFDTPINLIGYSLTWRSRFDRIGGIGPLGVDKDYRHKNIAYNLLVSSINELIDRNCQKAIIDWTNLMELYRKFGFEIWKSYTYLQLVF